jgi:phosphomannomutase/phosphoglucomutase
MAQIDGGLFKKYDIRGRAQGDRVTLTADAAFLIGQAVATYLQRHAQINRVVTGRDNRASSAALQSALVDGLRRAGVSVIDIGTVSTPLVYWYAIQQGEIGGVMVTGSHLAPEYNGFKLSIGGRTIFDAEITAIRRLIESDDLLSGSGDYQPFDTNHDHYISDIQRRLSVSARLKVVYDPGNGTAGLFVPRLMALWGQDALGINVEPDGTYPNHQPDPQKEENVRQLAAAVLASGAQVGFGYDGDADRVGVVDEKGRLITADRVLALLAQDMLRRHPGAALVADVLSSQTLFDAVQLAGGVPYMAASGHSLVKNAMREHGALLGGEMSGHMFFAEDYFGFDDAYFATGRILQLLARADKPLSQLNDELPFYYSTPEYRPHCPDSDKDTVIQGMRSVLEQQGYPIIDVDGVRVQFDKGWGIIRKSNTEPVLSLRFEGETQADALGYRDLFAAVLRAYPQVESIT